MARSFSVTFYPSDATVTVPEGTLILDAAARAGLFLEIPCGGQGRCGRCRVRVDSGLASQPDNPHLTSQQRQDGWVLSCIARVMGDLSIFVPPQKERERIAVSTVASMAAVPVHLDWPRYPFVHQLFLEIAPPTLEDNTADFDRLAMVLRKERGIEELSASLALMRRLSQTLRQANWQVTAITEMVDSTGMRLIDLYPGQRRGPLLAAAVDIGTTNVVLYLVDLRNGRLVDNASARNKQSSYGEDVISRIIYSQRDNGVERLHRLVIETINELLAELARRHKVDTLEIYDMVVAGNTTMTHLFLGLPPRQIRQEPYAPTTNNYPKVTAGELGVSINPDASIYCMPSVAAYVGGDITAGVLSSGLYKADKITLFLDVGTNGEIVLGNSDWLMTDACSAGPAFEGASIKCGMRAIKGAIEDVRINSLTLEPTISVIGDVTPLGICGSGMISALAEMHITGVVTRAGRIDTKYVESKMGDRCRARMGDHGAEYVIAWAKESGSGEDIVLTEVDINNIIRAKGAIYAGIAVMMRAAGVDLAEVDKVLIGGAFGQHINVEQAIQIGLLPDLPWEKFKYLGNTSAWGAYTALLSKHARAKAEEIARKMTYIELIADNSFMNEFTAALFLPHTDINRFPTVKALLEGAVVR